MASAGVQDPGAGVCCCGRMWAGRDITEFTGETEGYFHQADEDGSQVRETTCAASTQREKPEAGRLRNCSPDGPESAAP